MTARNEDVWSNLCDLIREDGGVVHKNLQLNGSHDKRGVFASALIQKGETLISLPKCVAIDGQNLPEEYKIDKKNKRTASPWLRCLAAFYQRTTENSENEETKRNTAFEDSLPKSYETLWQWSDAEVDTYLAGTTSPGVTWKADRHTLEQRYREQVKPFLDFLKIPEAGDAYERFAFVCQTMSTRCFHLTTDGENSDYYSGPFFLPMIDLLNHTENFPCTVLQRTAEAFVMVATRDVRENEEVQHSYGNHLTASQLLHTFGFVPTSRARLLLSLTTTTPEAHMTPAIIDRQLVIDACYDTIKSDYPEKVAKSIEENDLEDEVWSIPIEEKQRDASFLPDVLVARCNEGLPKELITAACMCFLPKCAYKEAARALLDESILEDYFLGKLACAAILKAQSKRLELYSPIEYDGITYEDDRELLATLLEAGEPPNRLIYGLCIRLEEKESLKWMRKEAIRHLAVLDEDTEAETKRLKQS